MVMTPDPIISGLVLARVLKNYSPLFTSVFKYAELHGCAYNLFSPDLCLHLVRFLIILLNKQQTGSLTSAGLKSEGMKFTGKIRIILLCSILVLLLPAKGSAQDVNAKVASSIRMANARELSNYFNATIDLSVPGTEGTFSKAQSEIIIRNFFAKYPPASYTQSHQGQSKDGSQYAIGMYKSGNTVFRAYYLIKTVNGKPAIHQLKFEIEE